MVLYRDLSVKVRKFVTIILYGMAAEESSSGRKSLPETHSPMAKIIGRLQRAVNIVTRFSDYGYLFSCDGTPALARRLRLCGRD